MNKLTQEELVRRMDLPLEDKVDLSIERIVEWYDHWEGNVYVSFSGGKDSTVLLDLVRSAYPDIPAVFVDTGLEYPEIRRFVRTVDNVTWIRPKMKFKEVIEVHGYPVVSKEQSQYIREIRETKSAKLRAKRLKRGSYAVSDKWRFLIDAPFKISERCCSVMKKRPAKQYYRQTGRYPYIGTLVEESYLRRNAWFRYGCNKLGGEMPASRPLSFWREEDIWE